MTERRDSESIPNPSGIQIMHVCVCARATVRPAACLGACLLDDEQGTAYLMRCKTNPCRLLPLCHALCAAAAATAGGGGGVSMLCISLLCRACVWAGCWSLAAPRCSR